MRKVLFPILALFSIFSAGCSHTKSTKSSVIEVDPAQRVKVVEAISKTMREVKTFRALYRVMIYQGDTRQILRYALLIEKPDKIRLDLLPTNGAYTLGVFLSKNGEALALDPINHKAFKSSTTSRAVKALLKLPLSSEELISIALGSNPNDLSNAKVTLVGNGTILIQREDDSLAWIVNSDSFQVENVQVLDSKNSAPKATITYQEFEKEFGVLIPKIITISVPSEDFRMELSVVNKDINKPINPEKFEVPVPDDYSVWEGLSNQD